MFQIQFIERGLKPRMSCYFFFRIFRFFAISSFL